MTTQGSPDQRGAGEWFREAFRDHYMALYAHRDAEEAEQTASLITNETRLPPGSLVLDAPCGAGRHARAFARLGYRVAALDLSPDLLASAVAAREAEEVDGNARLLGFFRCDLRLLALRRGAFDLAANLFSSLGYFATEDENRRVVAGLAQAVKPDGWLVIDFFNAARVRAQLEPYGERVTPDGWRVTERRAIVGPLGCERVEKRVRIEMPGSPGQASTSAREVIESVRLYEAAELEAQLRAAGVEVTRRFGDYDGSAMTTDSPRVILMGRRRA